MSAPEPRPWLGGGTLAHYWLDFPRTISATVLFFTAYVIAYLGFVQNYLHSSGALTSDSIGVWALPLALFPLAALGLLVIFAWERRHRARKITLFSYRRAPEEF